MPTPKSQRQQNREEEIKSDFPSRCPRLFPRQSKIINKDKKNAVPAKNSETINLIRAVE